MIIELIDSEYWVSSERHSVQLQVAAAARTSSAACCPSRNLSRPSLLQHATQFCVALNSRRTPLMSVSMRAKRCVASGSSRLTCSGNGAGAGLIAVPEPCFWERGKKGSCGEH